MAYGCQTPSAQRRSDQFMKIPFTTYILHVPALDIARIDTNYFKIVPHWLTDGQTLARPREVFASKNAEEVDLKENSSSTL